jgi:hypothetical protein
MLQLVTLWSPHLGISMHSTACGVRVCGFHPTPRPWQCFPTLHRAQTDLLKVGSNGAHLAGTKKAHCHKHTHNWVTRLIDCAVRLLCALRGRAQLHIAKTFAVPIGESLLTLVFVSRARIGNALYACTTYTHTPFERW